jgi:hypothetical protein
MRWYQSHAESVCNSVATKFSFFPITIAFIFIIHFTDILVYYLRARLELIRVEPLKGRLLALPKNIILGWN